MNTAEAIKCGDGLIQGIPFKIFLKDNSLYVASSLFIISELVYSEPGLLINHFLYNFEFVSFIALVVAPHAENGPANLF